MPFLEPDWLSGRRHRVSKRPGHYPAIPASPDIYRRRAHTAAKDLQARQWKVSEIDETMRLASRTEGGVCYAPDRTRDRWNTQRSLVGAQSLIREAMHGRALRGGCPLGKIMVSTSIPLCDNTGEWKGPGIPTVGPMAMRPGRDLVIPRYGGRRRRRRF